MTGKSYISKWLDMDGHTALQLGHKKVNDQNEHREMRNMQ
jgi:hypothetical protein